MRKIIASSLLASGCVRFDHTEGVTMGQDPFLIGAECSPTPLEEVSHADGTVTSSKVESDGDYCVYTETWEGTVLDLEDAQAKVPAGLVVFWEGAAITVNAAQVKQNGGAWVNVLTDPLPALQTNATMWFSAEGTEDDYPDPGIVIAATAEGGATQTVLADDLNYAAENAWYGQDPRLPISALAESSFRLLKSDLPQYAGELEMQLDVDLTFSAEACLNFFFNEPAAGAHGEQCGPGS